ncbi:MAG: hypothetical protein ACTSSH_12820, partial [Candidatus Heimdallarchaeota archaeon]
MKKINKSSLSALLIIFGFFVMTLNFWDNPATSQPIFTEDGETNESLPNTSQFIPRNIRVAIYDDANTTVPSYASSVTLTNNYSNIQTVLLAAGYEVTPLTTNQIYNHGLKTARYDAGILPPESVGDEGLGNYWSYQSSTVQNITKRHPVSRSYQVNDTFTISNPTLSATIDWVALQGTSIASELVKIATRPGVPDAATVIAFDPQSRGGKVVYIVNHRDLEDDAILIDAIEWLCPRPKGRILFDLSHLNGFGVDLWDNPFVYFTDDRFTIMRNNLVNRSYTFDKLYPSALGNFTTGNLAPYDLLILNLPQINFTASEVTNIRNWVNNGGGILALGDKYYYDGVKNLNYLLSSFDLRLIDEYGATPLTTSFEHPTEEGCYSITMAATSVINYTGNAYPLWGSSPTEICIAGKEYGNGRVILTSDVNLFDNTYIGLTENLQFSINAANWLTSDDAKILLYVDEPDSPNYYRTPVSNALNELGINFYLTFEDDYLNLSMNLYDWELVIIDVPWYSLAVSVLSTVNNFVKGGGLLIMSAYKVDNNPTHPLWARLGFAFDQDQPSSSSLYIWDASHRIFNLPVDYGATRFDPITNYGDEGDLLRVYPNATALAGYTVSETENNSNIVLGNGGKTLYNGYIIDQFTGDLDNSTYADNFELWINEIAYMLYQSLSVGISSPHTSDIFNATSPDFIITT